MSGNHDLSPVVPAVVLVPIWRRRWLRWMVVGALLGTVELMIGFGHGLVSHSEASHFANTVFRVHLTRQLNDPVLLRDTELMPAELSYENAGCNHWLPEELWRDCIAIGMNESLVNRRGVQLLQQALTDPCLTVDWLERLRIESAGTYGPVYDEKSDRYSELRDAEGRTFSDKYGNLITLGDARPDEITRMRNYFSCGKPRTRVRSVVVMKHAQQDQPWSRLTEFTFKR